MFLNLLKILSLAETDLRLIFPDFQQQDNWHLSVSAEVIFITCFTLSTTFNFYLLWAAFKICKSEDIFTLSETIR